MYKVKRFSQIKIKQFALEKNRKINSWSKNVDDSEHPEGSIPHTDEGNEYNLYNIVWEDPANPGKMITKFLIDDSYKTDSVFQSDLNRVDSLTRKRVKLAIRQLENGFVFNDDDKLLNSNKYTNKYSKYYNWDTTTHCLLHKFPSKSSIPYSKFLTNKNRLTYEVIKPEKNDEGDWYCRVVLSRCYGHHLGSQSYDDKNNTNTLADALSDELLKKLRSKGMLLFINNKKTF